MSYRSTRGFSLVELAVVMTIAALLLGSTLPLLTAMHEQARIRDTRRSLNTALEALLGFAAVSGRLPCPATEGSLGTELPSGGGNCTTTTGLLPAASLGLAPVDDQGFALDAWGGRLRYAVSDQNSNNPDCSGTTTLVFTTANCMRALTLSALAPNLSVCSAGCATSLVARAPAVIYSTGQNFATGGSGADERENPNPNSSRQPDPTPRRFISHEPTPADAPFGEFDDIVVWLSPYVLYGRMIAAGRLP